MTEQWEEEMRAVLDELEDELERDANQPVRPGMWIFRQRPDRNAFLRRAMDIVATAHEDGRFMGSLAATKLNDECSCRCKTHERPICPRCLDTTRCPAHSQEDPGRISPRWRREHGE